MNQEKALVGAFFVIVNFAGGSFAALGVKLGDVGTRIVWIR